MRVEGCSFGEMGVCEEVGGERNVAGKWLLLALFGGQRDKIKTEELVGVREIVRGEEDGGCVPRTGLGVSGRSWPVSRQKASRPAHSSENILFVVSASYTGFFSGRGLPVMAPSPMRFKVLLHVQPSGRSSCTSINWARNVWHVNPVLLMIFCIVSSFTKSLSRNW